VKWPMRVSPLTGEPPKKNVVDTRVLLTALGWFDASAPTWFWLRTCWSEPC
jgi:hypothetical protein